MAVIQSLNTYTIPNGGATKNLSLQDDVLYNITPTTVTIAAAMQFTTADTPKKGTLLRILYNGGVTSDIATGKTVSFFGSSLTDAQALLKAEIMCFYNGSTWLVYILMSDEGAHVGTPNIVNKAVTAAKVADYTLTATQFAPFAAQGSIIRSGAAGIWEELVAKNDKYFLMGDGIDLNSVIASGAFTFSNTGVATIANSYITPAMLAFSLVGEELDANVTITAAEILVGNGTPILIVGAPGAGYGIEVISASIGMVYVSAAYATNTIAQLITDTATVSQRVCNDILLSTVSRTLPMDRDFTIGSADTCIIANKALYFKVKTGNPITGDSDIKVKVRYRIILMP